MKIPPDSWRSSFGGRLGMTIEAMTPGHAEAVLEIGAEHCNPNGVCHGGAIFTLADDSMGGAIHPLCPPDHVPAATQVNVHYARSVRAGDTIRVSTDVLSQGRRTAVVESRVTDGSGRLVALLSASYLIVGARYAAERSDGEPDGESVEA
ncbi:MAG: PaaI family thioesterase [bacterium]